MSIERRKIDGKHSEEFTLDSSAFHRHGPGPSRSGEGYRGAHHTRPHAHDGLLHNLQDEALSQGFIVMAAVPPAVAILPMTRLLQGDSHLSLCSEAISYLASYKNLGLAAAISLLLFGPAASSPSAFAVLAETVFFIFLTIAKPRQP